MATTTIKCPQCQMEFPVEIPAGEIFNGEMSSSYVVPHHFTDDCSRCGRKFLVSISKIGAEYVWTEVKPKAGKSPLIIPGSVPISRLT